MVTTKPSEKKALPTVATFTYEATKGGWKEFSKDARLAVEAGYDLLAVTPLGTKSFGAVWKMVRPSNDYPDFFGDNDDEFPLASEDDL